jgi:hypothetical protein
MTIGWRYFRTDLDPQGLGDASKVGKQSNVGWREKQSGCGTDFPSRDACPGEIRNGITSGRLGPSCP